MYYWQSVKASEDNNMSVMNETDTIDSDDERHEYTQSDHYKYYGGGGSISEL